MDYTLTYLERAEICPRFPAISYLCCKSKRHNNLFEWSCRAIFDQGASRLLDKALEKLIPFDSPIFDLINNVRNGGMSTFEYGIDVESQEVGEEA